MASHQELLLSNVAVLAPKNSTFEFRALADRVGAVPPLTPFSAEALDFCVELSRLLRRSFQSVPEIQALAYWMRPAELQRIRDEFNDITPQNAVSVPRGTVLHFAPSNVDTLFMYSWILSLLAGNKNIIRLSHRAVAAEGSLLALVRTTLAKHPQIATTTLIVQYDHDRRVTDLLSGTCDIRIIWGGDQTVRAIRESPLPVHATELTFPDRFSYAAINTLAYRNLSMADRDQFAKCFYNDSFVFNQLGCSSPRLIAWVGPSGEETQRCQEDFAHRLAAAISANDYQLEAGTALAKLGYTYRSVIDSPVEKVAVSQLPLIVLDTSEFPTNQDQFCGGGVFFQMVIPHLQDLTKHVQRPHQTLVHFGFTQEELFSFATVCNGRGIDRIVPIGQALSFSRFWDGYDLLGSLTRLVTVQC